MKTGIVIGAAPLLGSYGRLKKHIETLGRDNIYLVAADGGIDFCIKEKVKPDCYIGDMDSTEFAENAVRSFFIDIKIETFPVKKDDTDMKLAVDKVIAAGCRDIYIYGGLGGSREAHTMANIQLIYYYARQGINAYLVNEKELMYVLCGGVEGHTKKVYEPVGSGFISVFALTEVAKAVDIEGLLYEYHGDLYNYKALGVSNEFCGKKASISVLEGALLIVDESLEDLGQSGANKG